jgi:hypothetical protein
MSHGIWPKAMMIMLCGAVLLSLIDFFLSFVVITGIGLVCILGDGSFM